MRYVVGIDIGGTFTDGVAINLEDSSIAIGKQPTTYPDPFEAVSSVLNELAAGAGVSSTELLGNTVKFVHATTLTSNVMLERRGAHVGLVATQGFGDSILMMSGKGRVAGLSLMERRHFRATNKPDPIVPGSHVVEVCERVDLDGQVLVPLSDEVVSEVCQRVGELGVDACAIGLLWSFRNTAHEDRIAGALQERFPGMFVSASSELAPLMGEYERTATAVVNCYVGPAVTEYLQSVEQSLRDGGLASPLLVVQSSGGVAKAAETAPVNTIESGPAAGVRGSIQLLENAGLRDAIVTDVGGTTFKVTLVRDRQPELTGDTVLGQYSLMVPMIDVVSIGAGGGSIAWVDGQRLRVGPHSAASKPGPACYGWGGTHPTVTDADLVLGYLNPDYFLGGDMKLSVEAARQAVQVHIADPLFGADVMRAAAGIREVIDSQMADLIRKVSLERGHDPREFPVLAYGGAGPVHVGAYAAELGCPRAIIPPDATVYSALGGASSDILHTFAVSRQERAPGDAPGIRDAIAELECKAQDVLAREGVTENDVTIANWAEVRYQRQFFDLRVPLGHSSEIDATHLREVVRSFESEYAKRYGKGARHGEDRVEWVRFGVEASGATHRPAARTRAQTERADASGQLKGTRHVWWREADGVTETPLYDGPALTAGHVVTGPAIIEHPGTCIAVHIGQTARIDEYLNTIIDLQEDRHDRSEPRHL